MNGFINSGVIFKHLDVGIHSFKLYEESQYDNAMKMGAKVHID